MILFTILFPFMFGLAYLFKQDKSDSPLVNVLAFTTVVVSSLLCGVILDAVWMN